jgi:hypothetical protein
MSRSRFNIAVLIIVLATLVSAALVQDASARSFDPTRAVDVLHGGAHSGRVVYTGVPTAGATALHAPTALRHITGARRQLEAGAARLPRFRGLPQPSPSVTFPPLRT